MEAIAAQADVKKLSADVEASELEEMDEAHAKSDAPYGDVPYADDGILGDGKKRFPIDCKHVKAALSYISQDKEKRRYTPAQYSHVKGKIISAYKRCFGESPPSAQ